MTAAALISVIVPLALAGPAQAVRVKTIRISDASIVEGDAGQQDLSFTISWTGSKGGPAPSVQYATADASATGGSDYTTTSGTANLTNGGCRCATVSVPVEGDTTTESTETFEVNLTNPVNATIGDAQGIGTIYDNEGPPALVVGDTSANEADGSLSFTVQLTNASASTVTVDYATADETAIAGTDYTAAGTTTLTYTPGQTSKTVTVTVADDSLAEEDETALLDLSNATNASIADAQGVGSIVNDDADPNVTIADVSVSEGDSGSVTATFTVSLSTASGQETAVDYLTSDTTATAGSDYTATSGTLTIPAGDTSATLDVSVDGETLYEGDETFGVTLSGEVNLTLVDAVAEGTITDDDPVPTVSAGDATSSESAAVATVTVSLTNPSVNDVSVDWSTTAGSATAGADYTAASGTATILAGETSTTVAINLLGDAVDEPAETFTVGLTNAVNAAAGAGATITLTDDDRTPTFLTVKVAKGKTTVKAKGLLETAASGLTVKVTLLKKKGAKFVRVASKVVAVKTLRDRDGDGKTDGHYVASFTKPARGAYRFKVAFAGTSELKRSSKSVNFTL